MEVLDKFFYFILEDELLEGLVGDGAELEGLLA